ncbi:hypothetical protein AXG93_2958s1430 [Marchantia polymorpha subsp. ruderalis]|uniref:Uncharacterized protein n=1 Tax=Marchantia polymorpha subsp. ruderalis TaxID=1480154 RepID=A0A176VJ03_MARPO|nr:hypothetical protein AXG93_2958s1430 [Marchantia polymorpha subsp. ruderalis]
MVSQVLVGRAVCSALGLIQATVVAYTCATDGSPFRKELLTPWMSATLIDFYITMFLYIMGHRSVYAVGQPGFSYLSNAHPEEALFSSGKYLVKSTELSRSQGTLV